MSRQPFDFYPTPASAIRPFLRAVDLPGGRWLEPAAGAGAIIRTVREVRRDVTWQAVELRAEAAAELASIGPEVFSDCPANYLHRPPSRLRFDVAITNPPFNLAERFVRKMLDEAHTVAALLPLAFMASRGRARFHLSTPADVYVLAERPNFTGTGTDMRDVAWFVWGPDRGGRWGVLMPEADQLAIPGTEAER